MNNAKRIVLRLFQFNPLLQRYILVQQFEMIDKAKAEEFLARKLKLGLDAKLTRAFI